MFGQAGLTQGTPLENGKNWRKFNPKGKWGLLFLGLNFPVNCGPEIFIPTWANKICLKFPRFGPKARKESKGLGQPWARLKAQWP